MAPHCPNMKPILCIRHQWHSTFLPLPTSFRPPMPVLLILLHPSPCMYFLKQPLLILTPLLSLKLDSPFIFPQPFPVSSFSSVSLNYQILLINISTIKLSG